ncbi:MAG: hypothetical protein ABGZ17_17225, partial [Planctomycetaceae bacterium]
VELLEAQLRRQEDALRRTQAELSQARSELTGLQNLSTRLKLQLAQSTAGELLPERADALFQVEGIQIDGRLTAITRTPNSTQPATLNLVFFPHDSDRQPIKVPGHVILQLVAVEDSKPEEPIARWNFTVKQVREHWHRGLIGNGFQFQLPCGRASAAEHVLLRVRFQTIDGRDYASQLRLKTEQVQAVESVTNTAESASSAPLEN